MKKPVTINITGDSESGKTTIGVHLLRILQGAGIKSEFYDDCVSGTQGVLPGGRMHTHYKVPLLAHLQDLCSVIIRAGEDPMTFDSCMTDTTANYDKILGLGSIIEFYGQKQGEPVNKDTYIDRVYAIDIHSDGRVSYYGELYSESPGECHEIFSDRIIDCIRHVPFKTDAVLVYPVYPAKPGDDISFSIEGDVRESGIVKRSFATFCENSDGKIMIYVDVPSGGQREVCDEDLETIRVH